MTLSGEPGEEVCGVGRWLRSASGGKSVVLGLAVLLKHGFGLLHQRTLRGVGAEGFMLALHDGADIEGRCPRGRHRGGAAFHEEAGCLEIEAVGMVDGAEGGVAFGRCSPVKGGGGED